MLIECTWHAKTLNPRPNSGLWRRHLSVTHGGYAITDTKLTTVTLASQRSGFRVRRSMLDSTLRRLLCPADAVSFLFIAHTQPRRRQLNCRSRLSLDLAARDALVFRATFMNELCALNTVGPVLTELLLTLCWPADSCKLH